MLKQVLLKPNYLFEVSWEVCNKVGGIYTVIATKAPYMQQDLKDNYIFIGPDIWRDAHCHNEFIEDHELFKDWRSHAAAAGLKVRAGRWDIECKPITILIDFSGAYHHKDDIFRNMWENFQVDSIHGGSDYVEPTLFGFYSGIVIESFCRYYANSSDRIIAQFHEWLTGSGIFHLKQKAPHIATIFTTHATVLGRCVAGSGWPFYSQFYQHEPGYAANYFNVVAKHTLEKACAHHADRFTTVSEITAKECRHFLYKDPHIITNNGIDTKVIKPAKLNQQRAEARKLMIDVASALSGEQLSNDDLFILKSCRYEFRNKGIDVFIDALGQINRQADPGKKIVAFILVPAHNWGPRKELLDFLHHDGDAYHAQGVSTHYLNDEWSDQIFTALQRNGLMNYLGSKVKIVYVPTFLNGHDGVFNLRYDELLMGFDLTAFPSYYEPWGYTPLESLSSYVPSITTSISGLALAVKNLPYEMQTGISIIDRNDFNEGEVVYTLRLVIEEYAGKSSEEVELSRNQARKLSQFFVWGSQLHRYREAYHMALKSKIN